MAVSQVDFQLFVNVLRYCHHLIVQGKCHHEGDGDIEQERTEEVDGFNEVELGKTIGREAAELLDLSLRHLRRILAAYRKEGAAALPHGNRGRKPHNALDTGLKEQVLKLAQSTYAGCNNQHFTELLAE